MPDIVKSAVANSVAKHSSGAGKKLDSKSDVSDACARIVSQTISELKSKIAAIETGGRMPAGAVDGEVGTGNKKLIEVQSKLLDDFEALEQKVVARMEKDVDLRVQAKLESEIIKVAGASAMGGLLLGMLSMFLFGRK